MASTFPTKLADDYVPEVYLRPLLGDAASPLPRERSGQVTSLRLIAFRSGRHLLAVTPLSQE